MASELEHENESTAGLAASCNYCGKDQVALLHHSNMNEPLLKPEVWLLSTGDLTTHMLTSKALSLPNVSVYIIVRIFSSWYFITSLMVFQSSILCLCARCGHSLCICVMCTVLRYTCVRVAWALAALASRIDAADLIKPIGLHVECQHCHQAQWEPNGGIGGIDPVESTASAQSRNQRPLRSKAMILSRDPLPGGKKGGCGGGLG